MSARVLSRIAFISASMKSLRPVRRRFVDLSVPLENEVVAEPPAAGPEDRVSPARGPSEDKIAIFPGLMSETLAGSEGWTIEQVNLSHKGTHVDAPSALCFDYKPR